jgi:choline dehydrogenase-like flavoprotein
VASENKSQRSSYHYIVAGSGAGGGSLARNLAKAGLRVLLLEAGGDHEPRNRLLASIVQWIPGPSTRFGNPGRRIMAVYMISEKASDVILADVAGMGFVRRMIGRVTRRGTLG